ncbi:MAG: glycosyltransferase family 2 protein [Gammaproteobacteria bacterium]
MRKKPRAIRFYPLEAKDDFTIDYVSFAKVPQFFAVDRMLRKLQRNVEDYKDVSLLQIKADIARQAKNQSVTFIACLSKRYKNIYDRQYYTEVPRTYKHWIQYYETLEFGNVQKIYQTITEFEYQPLMTLVLSVGIADEALSASVIDSVMRQSYQSWELYVAPNGGASDGIIELLQDYVVQDSRIRLVMQHSQANISEVFNDVLAYVNGDYIVFLDCSGVMSEHALYFVVRELNDHAGFLFIYSDADKIDAEGNRMEPYFKPDWNPDLLFSHNYIGNLTVYSIPLVRMVGGFRPAMDACRDYDLLLRCAAKIESEQILHVAKVLYHERLMTCAADTNAAETSASNRSAIRALTDYFASRGLNLPVTQGKAPNTYKVSWPIPQPEPLVSLLIPTRDSVDILSLCVGSILEKTRYQNFEVIILDNQSSDPETLAYFETFKNHPRVRVVACDFPFNFSVLNNYGVKFARGEIIGLINNDVEVIAPDWLTEMVAHALRPDIGCVGAKLLYGNDTVQHGGVICGLGGIAGHAHRGFAKDASGYFSRLQVVQNLSAVTAAVLLVRRAVYESVGGLNETELTVALNDVDFCLRVREAGYRNLWTPFAELYHHESISRGADDSPEKLMRLNRERKYMHLHWGTQLASDPYYNPHLTLLREDFSLRWEY